MIKRRQGHIVAISSIQGKISIPFRSAYAASKHATQAFFDCLRAEMEQYEIEVTVISPGYIHTNLSVNAITADGSRYGGKLPTSLLTWKRRVSLVFTVETVNPGKSWYRDSNSTFLKLSPSLRLNERARCTAGFQEMAAMKGAVPLMETRGHLSLDAVGCHTQRHLVSRCCPFLSII
uniref:Dehydrogenase/reductase SDR family member 7B n=1 Tax=Aotus nancymaae TaxID=37293 RepID=A0A2K5EYU4_AOTNA